MTKQTKNARDWLNRLRKLDVHFDEFIMGNMHALSESHLTILSELGAFNEDIDTGACLSALAQASESVLALNDEWLGAFERSLAPLDPGSPKAIRTLISTMQRCGYSAETQKAVVRLVGGELDAASEPENIRSTDVKAGKAEKQPEAPRVPTAGDMARFREKEARKRSLLTRGEILTEESFLQEAVEAVESILEMCPHVRQAADGRPTLEDEGTRAFSALRAALRCGVRAIVEDLDTSDNAKLEAAQ